jgi:ribonuclease J
MAKPQVNLRGVVTGVEQSLIEALIQKTMENCLVDRWSRFARSFDSGQVDVDWTGLQIELESALQRLVRRELQSRPLVVLMMQTPEEPTSKVPSGRRKQRSTAKVGS